MVDNVSIILLKSISVLIHSSVELVLTGVTYVMHNLCVVCVCGLL